MVRKSTFETAGGQVVLLSAFTLLVKALGFVKQAVIAARFGTSGATDVFFIASDFFADLSAVFFSPLAIVFLTRYDIRMAERGRDYANDYAARILRDFSVASAGLAVVFAAFPMPFARLLGFGFTLERQRQLSQLLRMLSVGLVFYCTAALLTALLQAQKRFLPAQGRGMVRSAAIIASVWLFSAPLGEGALTVGMLSALMLEVAFLLTCAKTSVGPAKLCCCGKSGKADNGALIVAAAPLVLSYAAAEFSHIVDKAIASRLHEGAVSALCYAQVLQSFAVALLVSNVGAVTFSHFSEKSAHSDNAGLLHALCRAGELIVLVLMPVTIISIAASRSLVALVYARGRFDAAALGETAQAFSGYAAGLLGLSLQTVFLRGLYARGNTRLPLKIGLWSIALNIVLSLALSQIFGVGGIAFASTASYILGAVLSSSVLNGSRMLSHPKAIGAAAIVCAATVALVAAYPIDLALLRCVALGMAGVVSYLLTLLAMREPNALTFIRKIHRKTV